MKSLFKLAAIAAVTLMAVSAQAAVVHTSDFIADATRTGFNGFEGIPNNGTFFTGGAGPYAEGGVTVRQVNGDAGNDIWVAYRPAGGEGAFGWYPDGGDLGYTEITRTGGGSFVDVGMLISSGFGNNPNVVTAYELWNNGILVDSGSLANSDDFHYLGFSGGGFDTILLSDGFGSFGVRDGHFNAFTVDAIEMAGGNRVPEPSSLALAALGLAAAGSRLRRQRG